MTTYRDTSGVVVLGGGPAGLQAALTLGRMHHDAVLVDSGSYRNDPADAMHNLIGHDGQFPADLRAAARADLATYPTVDVRETIATAVKQTEDGFAVETKEGMLTAPRVVLATGVRDVLPDVPGLAPLFGSIAAQCPYCHGHEFAGRHVGLLGAGPHTARVALLLRRIAGRLTVFTDGGTLDESAAAVLDGLDAAIREGKVTGARRSANGATLSFSSGPAEEVGGLMVSSSFTQATPFAEQLGLEFQESGCIRIDPMGRTSLSGVYAAGDLAHSNAYPMPLAAVAQAIAAGMLAATAIDVDEIAALTGYP